MWVENRWDELRVGVKGQSSSEIAGSPRNISRYSLETMYMGVEHWMDSCVARRKVQSNSEYHVLIFWSQSDPAKRSGLEGNIPNL